MSHKIFIFKNRFSRTLQIFFNMAYIIAILFIAHVNKKVIQIVNGTEISITYKTLFRNIFFYITSDTVLSVFTTDPEILSLAHNVLLVEIFLELGTIPAVKQSNIFSVT